ncbi:MAG: Na+/H+ antiporter NhaA [Magnetospirillum sp.]|nr:Na+/H+ antiporter NhaA [Magnetospirillum sp.]
MSREHPPNPETVAGAALLGAALLALGLANSPLAGLYNHLVEIPVGIRIGELRLAKPLVHLVNDGLMAVYFLLVGLEIKAEILFGRLSSPRTALLPLIAAIGGMAAPAALYALLTRSDPAAMAGWAIPSATDIAFAVGVLALLGDRVPASIRVFLLALAIIDDLGAIVVIAIFYTDHLSWLSLGAAAVGLMALVTLNLLSVTRLAPYVLVGVYVWVCVLQSGVHATLAGVAVGLAVPLRAADRQGRRPGEALAHMLAPWATFGILPLFAFANAGVSFAGPVLDLALSPVALGIALGLFVGKQGGVLLLSWLAVTSGLCTLPTGADWRSFYGMAILTGIGFTMSLFIGMLAFDSFAYSAAVRVGVLSGSLLSAVTGYLVLRLWLPSRPSH